MYKPFLPYIFSLLQFGFQMSKTFLKKVTNLDCPLRYRSIAVKTWGELKHNRESLDIGNSQPLGRIWEHWLDTRLNGCSHWCARSYWGPSIHLKGVKSSGLKSWKWDFSLTSYCKLIITYLTWNIICWLKKIYTTNKLHTTYREICY